MPHRTFLNFLYYLLIQPHTTKPDERRREFVLNVLLSGFLVAIIISVVFACFNLFVLKIEDQSGWVYCMVAVGGLALIANLKQVHEKLESKVIERTQELESEQLARLLELQPFAEFGRIGAGLVHDIANPLAALALNLEALNRENESEIVHEAQKCLRQLERYLFAARKQLKRESRPRTFAVRTELRQVMALLSDRARRANVRITTNQISCIKLYGDVVKFNQIVANLLTNAIDASSNTIGDRNKVVMNVSQTDHWLVIAVTDFGSGINAQQMVHLFEPFYSTKKSLRSGLGIGLAIVKQHVEEDFRGSITVTSTPFEGTTFTLRLRNQGSL